MNKAFIKGQELAVPGKWNELNREQLIRTMQVMFQPQATPAYVSTRLVAILLQLWKRPHLAGVMLKIPLLDLDPLRLLAEAFLEQPATLTKQLLPKLRTGQLRSYYGPGDELNGLSFEEWIAAEGAYYQYRQKKDPYQLTRLVAILYRHRSLRRKPNGDIREDYSQFTLERRTDDLKRLPLAEQYAVLFYYDSCRAVVIQRHPELFPGKEYDDDPDPVPTNPTRNYLLMLRELAGTPDRFDLIGQQALSNVFFEINERIAEVKRQEEKNQRPNG